MLRLPPPAGAYIQSEHSYQVGSALLWKRRAEAALDALDKAQRQLQACKRRGAAAAAARGGAAARAARPPRGSPAPQGAPSAAGGAAAPRGWCRV
ncbi:unnamed protein product, partial [Bubo scandiacus]